MTISMKMRATGWAVASLLAVLAVAAGLVAAPGLRAERAWAGEGEKLSLGVVDLEALVKAHPDFPRLQELDQQLGLLEQELAYLPVAEQRTRMNESQEKMRKALEKGRKELEAEYHRVTSELQSQGASMQARLQSEGQALQAQYQERLRREVAQVAPQDVELGKSATQRMKEFLADLNMVREQRLTARRLELEKQVQQRLEGERMKVESELAAYEDSIMRENQQKRLNLQLQLQLAQEDPEKEAELQAELGKLGEDEQARKDARREQLFSQLDGVRAKEKAALESELASYQRSLDAEVQRKAAAERSRLAGLPSAPSGPPPDIQRRIEQIKATINGEMAARKAQMEAEMQARAAEGKARLEKKQREVEQRIAALQKQLREMMEQSPEDYSEPTRQKMDALKAQIEEVRGQRDALVQRMKDELGEKVGQVARKQGIHSVVGRCVVNLNLPDFTDQSVVAIKQAPH